MELSELKTAVEAPKGVYLFAGEEEYLKRYYLERLHKVLVPDSFTEAFNYTVFDDGEIDVPALAEAVKAPPMMADKKLVVWKYADFERMKESTAKDLEALLSDMPSYEYTVLVFVVTADKFDVGNLPKKPSKLYKRYENLCQIVEFKKSTDTQLLSWLKKHFDAEGINVTAEVLTRLLSRVGHGMDELGSEVDKLCAYAKMQNKTAVDIADVDEVTPANAECDAFALSNALLSGDRVGAYTALRELKNSRTEAAMIVGMMARTYAELLSVSLLLEEGKNAEDIAKELNVNPYKVKLSIGAVKKQGPSRIRNALYALGDMDIQMKNGYGTSFGALETFIAGYLPQLKK